MRGVILDRASLGNKIDISSIAELFTEFKIYDETEEKSINSRIKDCDVVVANKVKINRKHLANNQSLKLIVALATGVDNIDLEGCREFNVNVSNARNYCTNSVAQHTFALILSLTNKILLYHSEVLAGKWSGQTHFCLTHHPIEELNNKNLLIVGFGNIGKKVAQIAKSFGMQVTIASIPGHASSQGEHIQRQELQQCLPEADIITIHCPLNKMTKDLFTTEHFVRMKDSALIINTSRGGIINEESLHQALKERVIAGAATDVLATEPPSKHHLFLQEPLPNLIVSPHCAWTGEQSKTQLLNEAVLNIKHFQSGSLRNNII